MDQKRSINILLIVTAIVLVGVGVYALSVKPTAPEITNSTPAPASPPLPTASSTLPSASAPQPSPSPSSPSPAGGKYYSAEEVWLNRTALLGKTITIEDGIDFEIHCPDMVGAPNQQCASLPVLGKLRTLNPTMTFGQNLYIGSNQSSSPYTECNKMVTECDGWAKGKTYIVTGMLVRPQGIGVMYFLVTSKK